MNRTFINSILLCTFMMCGCEKECDTTSKSNQSLINVTNNEIVYIINTDVGTDTIHSKGADSSTVSFTKYGRVSLPFIGPYSIDIERVIINSKSLYLLNDTTSYIRKYGSNIISKQDSVFFAHIQFLGSGDTYNVVESERLIFDKNILGIFEKDYSMLDKFKEYYKK